MVLYLVRTYLFHAARPVRPDVGRAEVGAAPVELAPREVRRAEAAEAAGL
jgi:hypothetical protein